MKKVNKLTKKYFCSTNKEAKKIRRNDPILFSVMFNEWKRNK